MVPLCSPGISHSHIGQLVIVILFHPCHMFLPSCQVHCVAHPAVRNSSPPTRALNEFRFIRCNQPAWTNFTWKKHKTCQILPPTGPFSGAKCPQTLPLRATPPWCNSPLMNKCDKLPPTPSDQSDASDTSDRSNLQRAISTFVFQLTLTLPVTYGNSR